jgi:hypothetical protein
MNVLSKQLRTALVNTSHKIHIRACELSLSVWLLAFMLSSCGDPLPIQHETEHLRIGSALKHPICAGDLRHYERVVATVEDELAVDLNHTLDLFVWSHSEWKDHANQYCGGSPARGCYKYNSKTVFTSEYALTHELVHATVDELKLPPFFGEGIAETYAGRQTRFAISLPSSHINDHSNPKTYDTNTAAHFVHWLRYKWGGQRLGELARLGASAFSDFERVYGVPFDVAEQLYLEEAPAAFPALYACDAPSMEFVPPAHAWSTLVELDCENDEETQAWGAGMSVTRAFTIDDAGPYYLYADRGWMHAALCIESPVEEEPNEEEELMEDIPFIHSSYPSETGRYFPGGVFHPVDLRAGLYTIRIGLDGFEAGSMQVDIWPRKGEHPE